MEQLSPDLLGFLKLIAQKRSALVIGKHESDNGKYSFSVHETLVGFGNSDEKSIILIRKSNGEILIRKSLLSKSEISVYFWLVWSSLRRFYEKVEDCDAATWQIVLENYRGARKPAFGEFFDEYNMILDAHLTPDDALITEESLINDNEILARATKMQILVTGKIMQILESDKE